MPGRGVRLTFGLLALALASSAGAQGNLDQGRTAPQLYALPAQPATNRRKAFPRRNGFSASKAFYASTIPPAANRLPFSPPI
jgi:hypothetical protein